MIEPDLKECLSVLRYTAQPTMGYTPSENIYEFIMEEASEYAVRLALVSCILMARRVLRLDVQEETDASCVQPIQTRLF